MTREFVVPEDAREVIVRLDLPIEHHIAYRQGRWDVTVHLRSASSNPWDDGPTGPSRTFETLEEACEFTRSVAASAGRAS